jgi:sugar phosphate isomerase/epimerase
MPIPRREFLLGMAATGAAAALRAQRTSCAFRLAVINDEISQDFDHACAVAAKEFGLGWIELRAMWNKNVTDLDSQEVAESQRILKKYNLRVTDIASPLYKVDWPGAPSAQGSQRRDQFHSALDFKEQDALLERSIAMVKAFGTNRLRCFDFWRIPDPAPYRAAINERLGKTAEICAKSAIILLLENEMSCNTATGAEAAATLKAVPNKNFMLNWDPGNAGTFPGAVPYPDGYNLLPKGRIGHCHAKDVTRQAGGKYEWAAVGTGLIDWVGQLRALKRDGYHDAVSLETHWRGAGTPEASTRISMQGLKTALSKAGISC